MSPVRSSSLLGARAARRFAGAAALCGAVAVAGCGGGGNASQYQIRAIFSSASFVQSGLDVRISGVTVGSVDDVELTDDNRAAVTFSITDAGFQDFRKDATCTIRPQALIGERYLECDLTQPRPDGATAPAKLAQIADGKYKGQYLLPEDRTVVPVDADQLLNVNSASVRDRFGMIIRELGTGVAGRGDEIATALRKGNEGLVLANKILKQLDDDTDMLKDLVSTSDQTLATLSAERDAVAGTIENGATVANRLAARKNEVKATIRALNDAFREVEPSVDRVTELTDELQPIADDLNRSSEDLATVFNLLPEVSQRGSTAITSLSPTLKRGTEVLTSDTTDTLFKRIVRTSGAVKSSAAVLGLTLGDFRSTGGLDYFLDAIYGLAYATNGRDANGSYLRGRVLNLLSCILPAQSAEGKCGNTLSKSGGDGTALPASGSGAAKQSIDATSGTGAAKPVAVQSVAPKAQPTTPGSTPTGSSPSATEQAAADLLLGGKQ